MTSVLCTVWQQQQHVSEPTLVNSQTYHR